MTGTIATVFDMLAAHRTARRRARNLRASGRRPAAALPSVRHWMAPALALLLILAGAAVIATHARRLAAEADQLAAGAAERLAPFQPLLPGVSFQVPDRPGITLVGAGAGSLVLAAGMRAEPALRIDLCTQESGQASRRMLPLHIGYRFADVARQVERARAAGHPPALRNVVLAAPGSTMPRIDLGGTLPDRITLRWDGAASWIGDASGGRIVQGVQGETALGREGWLVWGGGGAALRFTRLASRACPSAGELLLQPYRADAAPLASRALVTAFPARGAPLSRWLAPGSYRIPAVPSASAEDQSLFEQLRARGLVRLGAGGLVDIAPPDLAAWRDASGALRLNAPARWRGAVLDDEARRLLDRLYRQADGAYVREQVRVFNAERRLLAWRVGAGASPGTWQASVDRAPVASTAAMPAAGARLFANLPQGWGPWSRVADWPASDGAARLTLTLDRPAAAGQTLRVLLAGRLQAIAGAALVRAPADRCSGRACPAPDAVRELLLALPPGARRVTLDARPLDLSAIAATADQAYRHLRVAGGRLEWRPLPATDAAPRPALAPVSLADRNGKPLWNDGAPSAAAAGAGLATLLGVRAEHANSIAGMLARVPAPAGGHRARLTLDLALQAASQAALACIGIRHGHWDGGRCGGGAPAPAGRQAGLVVIDTDTGDILAAAGARAGEAGGAGWAELRDFDRADPARSPLRLPALQHDGGGNSSPGSTFKVISALGLELAAQGDRELDALLDGLPLARINGIARERGFAFRTDAAAYPEHTRLAHITNFRHERLDGRAEDGRLGLAQALTYSLNTWFAWTGELSDRSLFGRPDGGVPDLQALEPGALAPVRPIVDMAHRLGFERALRLDGGLLPADFAWSPWDALQGTPSHIDPIHARHQLRQMTIGLRMQATPLQMALVAGAVGQGRVIEPRLLLELDGRQAARAAGPALGVRLDRIRAGMKGVVDAGTAAGAFRGARFDALRRGLYGKTGTAPTGRQDAAGHDLSTVWFTCWLEPGSLPGQTHRLALAAYVSHSATTGGEHAAPIVAAVLASMQGTRP